MAQLHDTSVKVIGDMLASIFPITLVALLVSLTAEGAWAQTGGIPSERSRHADVAIDAQTLLRRAESGDAKAAWLLGTRYSSGRAGVQDDSEALRWFRRAADLGLAEAQYNLGIMYGTGRGVAKNPAEAARWFEAAAEQGLAQAQFNIGTLYSTGRGVSRNDQLAARWLRKAAEAGLPAAQYNLAVLYEHGAGVGRDVGQAARWYRAAAQGGFTPAVTRLKTMKPGESGLKPQPSASTNPNPANRVVSPLSTAGLATQRISTPITPTERAPTATPRNSPSAPRGTTTVTSIPGPTAPGDDKDKPWAAMPDSGYTVQLASFLEAPLAHEFVAKNRLGASAAVFPVRVKGQRRFSVVYGVYGSPAVAKQGVETLPARLRTNIWVRPIKGLRRAMAAK